MISIEPTSGRLPVGSGRRCRQAGQGACGERIGAGQRRVGDRVFERDDAAAAQLTTACPEVNRRKDSTGGHILPITRIVSNDIAAENIVAIGHSDRAIDISSTITYNDRVGYIDAVYM